MNICQYCEKSFSHKGNLNHHQKTAKFCLDKQDIIIEKIKFKCNCSKSFNTKLSLDRHIMVCTYNILIPYKEKINNLEEQVKEQQNKYDDIIKQLQYKYEEQIKDLQNKLENIALKAVSKPSININNNQKIKQIINNLIPVTDSYIKDQVSNLTIEHIKKGPSGYAEYILNFPLNKRIMCVDFSRKKIKYKDENGNIITDPEMTLLSVKLFKSIKERNKELINEYIEDISKYVSNETKLKIMSDMYNYITMIDRGSIGDKTELYPELTKSLCSQILL